jgi:hypothetical protein
VRHLRNQSRTLPKEALANAVPARTFHRPRLSERERSLGRNLTHFRFSGHSPIGVIISMVKVLLAGAFPVIFAIYRS